MTRVLLPVQARLPLAGFAVFTAVYTGWALLAPAGLGSYRAGLGSSVLYNGWGLAVLAYAVRMTMRPGSRSWWPLTVGLAADVLGDLIWDLVDRGLLPGANQTPSLVDLLYLPAYVALIWTTVRLAQRYRRTGLGSVLDTLVVAGGPVAALLPWLIHPYLTAVGSGPVAARVLNAFYPAGDVLITAALVALLLGLGRLAAFRSLALGFGIGLVADHIYLGQSNTGTYTSGGWLDWMWLAQYFLLALATGFVLPEALPPRTRRADTLYLAGLLGCAALCPAVLVGRLVLSPDAWLTNVLIAAATLLLVTAVAVRLIGLVRANQQTVGRLSLALAEGEQLGLELRHQARHAVVTGLPHRQQLAAEIDALDRSPGATHSVVFIDMDDFKAVNDTFGHAVGDSLLRSLGVRLRAVCRRRDLIARLGGDEFAVLMPGTDVEEATEVAQVLLGALRVPLEVAGAPAVLAATAGVAGIGGPHGDREGALARADLAMFAAKRAGKNCVLVYAEEMRDQVLGDAELAAELSMAIRSGQITAAYQPIVDLVTGQTLEVEALARWNRGGRMVPPDLFLPIAEQRGMLTDIDLHVLELTLAHVAAWRKWQPRLRVGFNMSAATLGREDLVPTILDALRRHRLPGGALCVEITEQVVVRNSIDAARRLDELRMHGIRVALDDFGSGYSSLSYLQRFPVDVVKLDRSFVVEGVVDGTVTPLLRLVIELGQKLGMTVLVEGLETEEQARAVAMAGARTGQGWLFAKAVPPAELPPLLTGSLLPGSGLAVPAS